EGLRPIAGAQQVGQADDDGSYGQEPLDGPCHPACLHRKNGDHTNRASSILPRRSPFCWRHARREPRPQGGPGARTSGFAGSPTPHRVPPPAAWVLSEPAVASCPTGSGSPASSHPLPGSDDGWRPAVSHTNNRIFSLALAHRPARRGGRIGPTVPTDPVQ